MDWKQIHFIAGHFWFFGDSGTQSSKSGRVDHTLGIHKCQWNNIGTAKEGDFKMFTANFITIRLDPD